MKKLKYVKLFENFMINEDILELNSFARKLYTFLKDKDVNVSLGNVPHKMSKHGLVKQNAIFEFL